MSNRNYTRRCPSPTNGMRRWHVLWEEDGQVFYTCVMLSRHITEINVAIDRAGVPDGIRPLAEPEL